MIMNLKFVSVKSTLFGLKVIVGMRFEGHKQPFPNIQKKICHKKENTFCHYVEGEY